MNVASSLLPASLPLGPFEGHPVNGFTTAAPRSKFHLQESCARLRRSTPIAVTEPLSTELLARLCGNCFIYPALAPRGSSLHAFVLAVGRAEYELQSYTETQIDECIEDENSMDHTTAVQLLADERRSDGKDDDESEDRAWEASKFRRNLLGFWSRCFESLAACGALIALYPWTADWAAPYVAAKEAGLAHLRDLIGELIKVEALLPYAVADTDAGSKAALADVLGDPRFRELGSADERYWVLSNAYRNWRWSLESDLADVDFRGWAVSRTVDKRFGKRRKGKEQARAAVADLVAVWEAALIEAVASADTAVSVLLEVTLTDAPDESPRRGPTLSDWETAVIAFYGHAYDWPTRTVLLRLPAVFANRLIEDAGHLAPKRIDESALNSSSTGSPLQRFLPAEGNSVPVGPTPGLLDDGPIANRKPINTEGLAALGTVIDKHEPLLVMSVTGGVEVVRFEELQERCARGWTGILLLRLAAPPTSLAALHLATKAKSEPSDPPHRLSLNADEAAANLIEEVHDDRWGHLDHAVDLTAYAAARNLQDLRALGAEHDERTLSMRVWHALLADECLDLESFRTAKRHGATGLAVPIGMLNTVQVYAHRHNGYKHHGMFCSRGSRHRYSLSRHAELLTLPELVNGTDHDWCSICGGYSVRRMSPEQFRYYSAAVLLNRLDARIEALQGNRDRFSRSSESREEIIKALDELDAEQVLPQELRWSDLSSHWNELRQELRLRAQALKSED